MKHIKTPIRVGKHPLARGVIVLFDSDDVVICDQGELDNTIHDEMQDIAIAVNSHDALVANLINCCCALEKMGVITFAAQLADAKNALEKAGVNFE